MARVLVPLPAQDFDPSEAAVCWRILVNAGHTVNFATPDGRPAVADDMMLTGKGLDPWGAIPLLRNLPLVGLLMRANRDARKAYAEMTADPAYRAPQRWDGLDVSAFDGLLLPGGHRARGMRGYLESEILQRHVASFFDAGKAGGGHLSWRIAGGAQHLEVNRALGSVGISDHRLDLGVRAQRLGGRALHALLGSELLPDLSGAERTAEGLYVGAAGSNARARTSGRFLRCAAIGYALSLEKLRAWRAIRSTTRRRPSWCGIATMSRRGGPATFTPLPRHLPGC